MKRLAALLLLCAWHSAQAAQAELCYDYGCSHKEIVAFSNNEMHAVEQQFAGVKSPADERQAISVAVGMLLQDAGKRTPIHNDKGGNLADDGMEGRMDCIDHSHTTTALLHMLDDAHLLRFYQPLEPVERAPLLVNVHWSAQIRQKDNGDLYVVDTWFFDNGHPAVVMPLAEWHRGASPDPDKEKGADQLAKAPEHE